jgi:hypothetical protein
LFFALSIYFTLFPFVFSFHPLLTQIKIFLLLVAVEMFSPQMTSADIPVPVGDWVRTYRTHATALEERLIAVITTGLQSPVPIQANDSRKQSSPPNIKALAELLASTAATNVS